MTTYNINNLPTELIIGRQTETGVFDVRIDCAPWLALWPELTLSIWVTPPGGAEAYPAVTHMEADMLVWDVNSGDTAVEGKGTMEVMGLAEGLKKLSAITTTQVLRTTTGATGEPPEPAQAWVDQVINAAQTAATEVAEIASTEAAELAAQKVLESIPDDYETLSATVDMHTGVINGIAAHSVAVETDWVLGSIKSADGANTSTLTTRIRTGFLSVDDTAVVAMGDAKYAVYYYKADKQYLPDGYIAFITGGLNIQESAPAEAAFFRLVAATVDDADLTDRVGEVAAKLKILASTLAYVDSVLPKHEMLLITEFEYNPGHWDLVGGIGTTGFYSQPLPVTEGRTYYIGYRSESAACTGAYLDANGRWLRELRRTETTVHEYQNADGNGERTDYAKIFAFTAPAGARYVSLNLTDDAESKYHQFLSTKPVFALEDTGNYIVYEGDPAYQAKKNKSLCVIGASGVTIDRLKPSEFDQYIVGFQDYLAPWYKHVGSYGFWSGSWADKNQEDNSIYNGIVGVQTDLTEYDEFLLIPSTAEVVASSDVGEITSTNTQTYMGGLNGVITYIYSQVPNAKIYLANVLHKGKYFTNSTTKALMDEINNKLAELSALKSYQLIDLVSGSGINDKTYLAMTYDGTHLNQEGSKVQGLFIRKEIIGI